MKINLAPKSHSLLPEATSPPSIPFSFTFTFTFSFPSHMLQLLCASSSSTFRTISFSQHGEEASTVISFSPSLLLAPAPSPDSSGTSQKRREHENLIIVPFLHIY